MEIAQHSPGKSPIPLRTDYRASLLRDRTMRRPLTSVTSGLLLSEVGSPLETHSIVGQANCTARANACLQSRCLKTLCPAYQANSRNLGEQFPAQRTPVNIVRVVRSMRGPSRSVLVEADNQLRYVVKYQNNPMTTHSLIIQLVAGRLLRLLDLSTPAEGIIRLSRASYLGGSWPQIQQCDGSKKDVVEGWHFASQYGDGAGRCAIYDFLPRSLLHKVENRSQFASLRMVDAWLGMAGDRQAVYRRSADGRFRVSFIDQKGAFRYTAPPDRYRYFTWSDCYRSLTVEQVLDETVKAIEAIDSATLHGQIQAVPDEWFSTVRDLERVKQILGALETSRNRLRLHVHRLCAEMRE